MSAHRVRCDYGEKHIIIIVTIIVIIIIIIISDAVGCRFGTDRMERSLPCSMERSLPCSMEVLVLDAVGVRTNLPCIIE